MIDEIVLFGSKDNHIYALDSDTGEKQWAYETDMAIDSSPTVAAGTAFIGSWDSNLYALNTNSGKKEWSFETGGPIKSPPTVASGTVFVGSWDSNMYALDANITSSSGLSEDSRILLGTLGHHNTQSH